MTKNKWVPMTKNRIVYEVIDCVRSQLPDEDARITKRPTPFSFTWWPSKPYDADMLEQLKSDYGDTSGPEDLEIEIEAEIGAIRECLKKLEPVPDTENRQGTEDLLDGIDQWGNAFSIWEKIAFPLRRRGDFLYHIYAPRNLLGGTPIFDPLPVDDYIRGVSLQTIRDKLELARLQKHLDIWRLATGVGMVAVLILAFA